MKSFRPIFNMQISAGGAVDPDALRAELPGKREAASNSAGPAVDC
jgi:hypothetical protein